MVDTNQSINFIFKCTLFTDDYLPYAFRVIYFIDNNPDTVTASTVLLDHIQQ